jgi:hypothetical protein
LYPVGGWTEYDFLKNLDVFNTDLACDSAQNRVECDAIRFEDDAPDYFGFDIVTFNDVTEAQAINMFLENPQADMFVWYGNANR